MKPNFQQSGSSLRIWITVALLATTLHCYLFSSLSHAYLQEIVCKNEGEVRDVAKKIARQLKPPDKFAVFGYCYCPAVGGYLVFSSPVMVSDYSTREEIEREVSKLYMNMKSNYLETCGSSSSVIMLLKDDGTLVPLD